MEGHYISLSINVLALFLLTLYVPQAAGQRQPLYSALYVFGDSTIDPGNNNFLATVVKSDFPPYGRDFPNGRPTGRFTNGRLVTDQLCKVNLMLTSYFTFIIDINTHFIVHLLFILYGY